MAKKPERITFQVDESAPEAVQAASLAAKLLAMSKCATYDDLERFNGWKAEIVLTARQRTLLHTWRPLLDYLHGATVADDGTRRPAVTISVCPVCGRFEQSSGASGSKCRLTIRCPGHLVKATAAKAITS